jgi:hypothetical protein
MDQGTTWVLLMRKTRSHNFQASVDTVPLNYPIFALAESPAALAANRIQPSHLHSRPAGRPPAQTSGRRRRQPSSPRQGAILHPPPACPEPRPCRRWLNVIPPPPSPGFPPPPLGRPRHLSPSLVAVLRQVGPPAPPLHLSWGQTRPQGTSTQESVRKVP